MAAVKGRWLEGFRGEDWRHREGFYTNVMLGSGVYLFTQYHSHSGDSYQSERVIRGVIEPATGLIGTHSSLGTRAETQPKFNGEYTGCDGF